MTIQTQRDITMPGIWAKNAATTIPNPPIPGQAYRNPSLDKATIEAGQAYSSRADSAQWNQWNYSCSVLESEIERYGVLPYSQLTIYPINGICLGDGAIYQALQENGPGTTIGVADPSNKAVWKVIVNPAESFLKFTFIDTADKEIHVDSVKGKDAPDRGTLDAPYKTFYYAFMQSTATYIPRVHALGFSLAVGGAYTFGASYFLGCLHTGEKGFFVTSSAPGQKVEFSGGFGVRYTPCTLSHLSISGVGIEGYPTVAVGQYDILQLNNCNVNVSPNQVGIFADIKSIVMVRDTAITLNQSLFAIEANYYSELYIDQGNSINGILAPTGYTVGVTNHSVMVKANNVPDIPGIVTGGISRGLYQGLSSAIVYSPTFIPGVGSPSISSGAIYL